MPITPTPVTGSPDCHLSPVDGGALLCHTCGSRFDAEELEVSGLRRVEGGSDPAYQELEVDVTPPCPEGDGKQQHMRLGYGATASRKTSLVVEGLSSSSDDSLPGTATQATL